MHPPATAGGTDLDSKMSDQNAAKSSTRRGPHIIGVLLFAWSWFVAGALLLIFAPPVLLLGILFKRQNWIYWWANWGARNWLRLTGVKVNVTGRELLEPNQATFSLPTISRTSTQRRCLLIRVTAWGWLPRRSC